MRTTRRRLIAGTAAAVLLLGGGVVTGAQLLPGAGAVDRPSAGMGMGMGSAMPGMAASADAMFAVQMAVHHESAVQMARLAQQRAQRPEVRQLARDIERTQTAEIAQLRDAATRLGADPDGPAGGMGSGMSAGMGSTTDLAEVPDEQFDRAFLEAMIPHHQMGVHMARMVQRAGSDRQIAAMAAEMVRVQTDEIALMQRWLDEQ
ncbi:MAG: DUF305 domain-containing protein [Actinomycetota bacterium]|nr:DUF305 domain-containing protein [Actinomycetota bacterium]